MAKLNITAEMWERIRRKSPAFLPDNPTAMGWTAREIKEALYRFILDEKDSVRALIELLAESGVTEDEVKALIEDALKDYTPGTGGGTGGGTSGEGGGVDEAAVRSIITQVVPAWARSSTKPTYSKSEVGLDNVDNVKQYSGENPPDYPVDSVNGKTGAVELSASDVGARPATWMPTASEVGADPAGTASGLVSAHNVAEIAHNDIRLQISELRNQLNSFLNVDDETRNELSEVLALIDANADVIAGITTSKVSVTDIINDLVTNVSDKPLSAAQGVALKALIDALTTGKLDASALPAAVEQALTEAKESGEFDGFSPEITLSRYSETDAAPGGVNITVKNKDGTFSTQKVQDGPNGTSVAVSSTSESTESGGENVVNFTDGKTLTVKNGKDGVSPTVSVTEITGGHRVSIKDAGGTKTFDVLDGVDGADGTGTGSHTVPDYWKTAVDTAIAKVKALQNAGGKDVVNFAWCSDLHYGGDKTYVKNVGIISAAVMDGCDIPLALMNGDTLTAGVLSTEDKVMTVLDGAVNDILAPIGDDRLMLVRGNHDDVYGSYTSGDTTVSYVNKVAPAKIWNSLHRWQATDFRRVFGGDGTYFYLDNIPQKVRFVCLNSHFYDGEGITNGTTKFMTFGLGTDQLDWLENVALDVEDGWGIVPTIHVPPTNHDINGRTGYLNHYGDEATAFRNILTAKADNIIALFCGHAHADAIVADDLPFPIVTITCAINTPYDADYSTRVPNSTNETALDIVSINKAAKTINMTRLGYGSDRVVGYGDVEIVTYSVTNNLTNCTSSNSATTVEEGSAYSATLTAKSGYVLDSVTVTMGGSTVTVKDGVISIASVTGDIIITATATAEETEPSYTNLWDKSQARLNTRYSFSSGSFSASNGTFVTGWAELPANAAENEVCLYTKGLNLVSNNYGFMIGTDNVDETSGFEFHGRYNQLNDTSGAYSLLGEVLDADSYYYKIRLGYNANGEIKGSGVAHATHVCLTYQVGTTTITTNDLPDFIMSFEPIE